MTDSTIIRKQHNGVVENFVYADVAQDLERSILRALTTLWHTGLSPHRYDTIEKAAEGAADIIRSLRDHLDNPPPDVQEKVLAMRGECKWTPEFSDGDQSNWNTGCGHGWIVFGDDGPTEAGMQWCPMCGRKLVQEEGAKQ